MTPLELIVQGLIPIDGGGGGGYFFHSDTFRVDSYIVQGLIPIDCIGAVLVGGGGW